MASLYRIASNTSAFRIRIATFTTSPNCLPTKKSINFSSAAAAAVSLSSCAAPNGSRTTSLSPHHYSSILNMNANAGQTILQLQPQKQQLQQPYRNIASLQRSSSQQQMPLSPHKRSVHHDTMAPEKKSPSIFSREVTKNITLYTARPFKSEIDPKTLECKQPTGNPLVVLMAWLMAKQKHLKKYAEIYTELGFDVMVVHITPWQLLWPTKGTQIVAAETLNFLEHNKSYTPIVVHGFSVGAYQFGEVMLQMTRDMDRYSHILDRMASQVWDSAADITEIPVGLPKSIFPRNPRMETALRNYVLYHMKTFHNQATIHYMRSSQMFHSTLLKKPALFFVCKNDLVGPPSSNHAVREDWERVGVKVTFKCWEKSMHASHLIKHRDEYLALLFNHLENTGVLESIGMKSRAKL